MAAGTPTAGAAPISRRPLLALSITLLVQSVAALAMVAPSVMAPVVAPLIGLPAERVGIFVGVAYVSAMFSGLWVGVLLGRAGPVLLSGVALAACAAGLAVGAIGAVETMLVAAVLIGLAYGIPNPTAALLLGAHAPPKRRGLFFSIKQAGVPVGVGIAGLLVPALLGILSWRVSLLAIAALCLLLAFATRLAGALDRGAIASVSGPDAPASPRAPAVFGPLVQVFRNPPVRKLGLASIAFSVSQLCFLTFLVSYLKLEIGFSLAVAAGILSASQLISIGARVFWGLVADHWIRPGRLLGMLGLATGASLVALGLLPPGVPTWIAVTLCAATAATVMSWNGVFYAELVRLAPADEIAGVTGATQFLTFAGAMLGPVVFGAAVSTIGSYGIVYIGVAVAPTLIGLWLLQPPKKPPQPQEPQEPSPQPTPTARP
jgi:MFS family permease